jgi:hypothetical protein
LVGQTSGDEKRRPYSGICCRCSLLHYFFGRL